jgi:ribosomal protein L11 methyltransferase
MRAASTRAFDVIVPRRHEDVATAYLWECGTSGIEVRNAGRGQVTLRAYFPSARGLTGRLRARLRPLAGAALPAVPIPRVDWVARFKEGFQPRPAAGFAIVPSWLARREDRDRQLVVEPGRAFGTGTHATTRLCLQALAVLARERPLGRVADLGAGTGILSIAALRLGARSAAAVENDPEAVASARRHARLNRVRLGLVLGDLARPLQRGRFDTVLGNLIASLLHNRAAEIVALGARSARFVLSGILGDHVALLRRTYRGAGRIEVLREGEWAALVVRPARA